jgi:thiol-disulfide isomerase/thioredoxin
LQLGDPVPDLEFDHMLNFKSSNARLSDFRGDLIILDMWATWCTSCIAHIPKMDSLKHQFGNRIDVILLNTVGTGDNIKKVETFIDKYNSRYPTKIDLPFAVLDSATEVLFPHTSLPHYVWINKDHKVVAITAAEEVTEDNINAILSGKNVKIKAKRDVIGFDVTKPLFPSTNNTLDYSITYQSTFSGPIEGIGTGTFRQDLSRYLVKRITFRNMPKIQLIKYAFNVELKDNRTKVIGSDSINFIAGKDQENTLCYEQVGEPRSLDVLKKRMRSDLESYLGYTGTFDTMEIQCYVIIDKPVKHPGKQALKSNETDQNLSDDTRPKFIQNITLERFIEDLNDLLPFPIINESVNKDKISVTLPTKLTDMGTMAKNLNAIGLDIIEKKKMMQVFTIQPLK